MKEEMRKRIKQLRSEGYGYKRIAKSLQLTVSAVRYACQKLHDEELMGHCKHCGVAIKSLRGKKRKQFCCDRCRWDYWNELHRNEKVLYQKKVILIA